MRCKLAISSYLLLFSLLPFSAHSKEKSWENDLIPKEIQEICNATENLEIPKKDYPTAEETKNLKDCSSSNLYYGISVKEDSSKARKCAIIEYQKNTEGGSDILMMIYANAEGVDRNLPLARKMSCDMWSAPVELELRLSHIERIEENKNEKIDICDDITSGLMMGWCASKSSELVEQVTIKEFRKTTQNWSAEKLAEFELLEKIAREYEKSHASNEVDMSGTARGMYFISERDETRKKFRNLIKNLEKNSLQYYPESAFKIEDELLNTSYKKALKVNFDEISQITPSGIKSTEIAWIKYRDAMVNFVSTYYPNVTESTIKTNLTIERLDTIDNIGSCLVCE